MSATASPTGPQPIPATMRGTILRVPDATAGVLRINGNPQPFLAGLWKSPSAPAPNMAVDVEFDAAGMITAITAVDARAAAKEQVGKLGSKLGELAQGPGRDGAILAKRSLALLAARMGMATLVATVVLWIAWFFLPGYALNFGFLGSKTYTIWEFLGLNLESMGGTEISHGFWAMLGIVCIAAPFVLPFMKNVRARFGFALPLVYSAIAIFAQRASLLKVLGGIPDSSSFVSMQFGGWVVLAAGVAISARALKR